MNRRRKIQPVVTISRIGEAPSDTAYWRTQTPQARLAALEEIRREYHGWKHGAEPRVQRVYRVIKCHWQASISPPVSNSE